MNAIERRSIQDRTLTALLVLGLLLVLASISSCAVDRARMTPDQVVTHEQLEQEYVAAEASGDPVALAAAEAKLEAYENEVMRQQAGPVIGALASLPGVGPMTALLSPLLLAGLPLLSKRGRQKLKDAAKGTKTVVGHVAGAYGMKHSTPASEAAASSSTPPNG